MGNIIQGTGKYGVEVKYHDGGKTTWYFSDKVIRDQAFKRIKGEVSKQDKVIKKNK